ncbi:hypothetical protein ACFODT_17565 [Vibrio zhugei]|uniref:YcxB family protein n=1 Tax=Vibrio zhugei TaxID=2479546 RepID=A0ABV7CBY9_9VIBR|nr:hypothetical protein [Vibrio zhugei]
MISNEEIKQRQAQLDSEEIIFEWEAIYPAIIGKNSKLARFCLGALPMLIVGILYTWFVVLKEAYITLIPMYVGLTLACYFVYFLQLSDNKCCYQLTQKGVITYTQQNIPESVYRFFRGFAWFGMGICVVAAVVVGPAVFVGAGAFALMSFAFRDFKPKVDKRNYLFWGEVKIYDIYDEHNIMFVSSAPINCGDTKLFYNNEDTKNIIINNLYMILKQPDFLRVKTSNDAYNDEFMQKMFKSYREQNPIK